MVCNPRANPVGVRGMLLLAFSFAMLLPAWGGVAAQAPAASTAAPTKAACDLLTAKEASDAIGLPVEQVPVPSPGGRNMCWFRAAPSVGDPAGTGGLPAKSVAILVTPCAGSLTAGCAALVPDPTQSSENPPGRTVEEVGGLGESARFITEAGHGQRFMILNVRTRQSDAGMQQSVIHLQLMSTDGEFSPGRKAVMIEAMKLILPRAAQAPASSQAAPAVPVTPRRDDTLTKEQAASGQPQRPSETASAQANTPVGHWVAEHPSKGGIGSWWEFRPDGSLTMHAGVVITFPITRSGNTMTRPGDTVNGPPRHLTFQVVGETLHLIQNVYEMAGVSDMAAFRQKEPDYKGPETIDTAYSRVGAAPSAADPLLGQWKFASAATPPSPSTDPGQAALQKMALDSITLFSADGTESLRMPFSSIEGTWDASAHTFHYANQATVYSFERTGAKLTLGQPPNNTQTDTYLPDPYF